MLQKFKRITISGIPLGKHLSINIWFLPILICAFFEGYSAIYIFSYLTALIHELSHVITAKLLKVKISRVEIYPFGVCARLSDSYIRSSEKEFVIAFSGPLSNLILFWICFFLSNFYSSQIISYLIDLNIAMCLLNLLPSLPLDGGRILKSILTCRYGILRAYNFMIKLSRVIITFVFITAIIIFLIYSFNFSLILISVFLLQNVCSEQKAITLITIKEILIRKDNFPQKSEMRSKVLCVNKNTPARTILKYLTYDYIYIVNIVDDSGKIIKTVTETQVLSMLTEKGIRTKYADI